MGDAVQYGVQATQVRVSSKHENVEKQTFCPVFVCVPSGLE